MTFTFKLASRLARFRSAGLTAILFTLACAGTDSLTEPQSNNNINDPSSIAVLPDSATIGVDGDVQFTAHADTTQASYRSWSYSRWIQSVKVRPEEVKLAPGATQALTATAQTPWGSTSSFFTFRWVATGGTVSSSGKYVAGSVPGRYMVIATAPNGMADTASVEVTGTAGRPTRSVSLTPGNVTLAANEQKAFSLAGRASDGSSFAVDPEYQATGGTISRSGTYTAGQTPGSYRVIATDEGTGMADTSTVTITGGSQPDPEDPPTIASVTVSPSSTALTLGETKQLQVVVRDSDGNTVSSPNVSWSSSNRGAATVSAAGLVNAVAEGSTTITASSGGKSGSATITVRGPTNPPPPPTGGSFAACEDLPAASRTVNVSSSSALSSALSNAQPGDRIVLASGTYDGGRTVKGRRGTASQPIVLCGPRSAVLTGNLRFDDASYWIVQGFTSRGAFQPLYWRRSHHNRVQGLEVSNSGQEGIHFLCSSTENVVQANHVHDTGRSKASSGEAVYFGTYPPQVSQWCEGASSDQSSRNQVIGNRFGPNVTAEDMQAQPGSNDGVYKGNTSDGTGKRTISGHFDASVALSNNTSGWLVEGNTLKPAAQDGAVAGNGIVVYSGASGHTIRNNTIDMRGSSGYAIRISGSGTMSCDNSVTNGRLSNVSCR